MQYFPRLVDRQFYENWVSSGEKRMGERLNEEVKNILKNYKPEEVSKDKRREITAIIKAAEKKIGIA